MGSATLPWLVNTVMQKLSDSPIACDRAVLHSWHMVRLSRLAEESSALAEDAAGKRAAATAANDDWRKKVAETLYPQLQQKKEALRRLWKETRHVIEKHLTVLQTGCTMLAASDIDGWCALHHAASQGFDKLVRALLTAGEFPAFIP